MKIFRLFNLFLILNLLFMFSCKKTGPELISISPDSRAMNMPAFTLTVTGTGFENGSVIKLDGDSKITTFISDESLSCRVSPNDLVSNSSLKNPYRSGIEAAPESSEVIVENPDGSRSNKINLSITKDPEFPTPEKISPSGNNWYNPKIATAGESEVYIVFERYDPSIPKYYISLIRSSDNGKTWSDPVDIFSSDERCYNPRISSGYNGRLDVIFYNIRLYYSQSDDKGVTWSPSQIISNDTATPLESDLFTDTLGNINIVWAQYIGSHGHIFFRRSGDGGAIFSTTSEVSSNWSNFGSVYKPSISGDYVGRLVVAWIAWPDYASKYANVYTNYSTDGGTSWNDNDYKFGITASPDVEFSSGGDIFLIMSDSFLPFQDNIKIYKAKNDGDSWSYLFAVSGELEGYYPVMKVDPVGNINVMYSRSRIFQYTRSTDGGINWSTNSPVTDTTSFLDMAVDTEGNIYIVYEKSQSAGRIYFMRSK